MRHCTYRAGCLLAALGVAGVFPLWSASYGQLPLTFEANRGQAGAQVLYLARGQGYGLFLSQNSATLRLISKSRVAELRMSLLGAAANPVVEGTGALAGSTHYYRGQDPRQWVGEVPTFARVRYDNLYPGVDLVFYGNQRSLEYDFVVAPGANPHAIALAFDGASRIQVDPSGDLLLSVPGGQVRLLKPVAYQEIAGVRCPVTARYRLNGGRAGVALGSYDTSRPLIIDPTLNYSSYLGGSDLDGASAIAVDTAGNAYIAGWTVSANFPTTSGAYQPGLAGLTDAFVAKIDPLGQTRLFSTFLGGSADDTAEGIAVDALGNVYVVGSTQSANFPTLNPLQSYGGNGDGFISKLTSSGALVYSTYLGGNATDDARAVAVDASGNAYVAGMTGSSNFPVTVGAYQAALGGASDAFVVKLNASGSAATYSTYLGGSGTDEANAIAIDSSGDAWVAGFTWSSAFPTQNPRQAYGGSEDGFVTKLNPAGTGLLFSTFLGGSSLDLVNAIAVDGNGNAYVAGSTGSVNFPVTTGVLQGLPGGFFSGEDAFVVKYNSAGTQVMYSTYLGGSSDDLAYAITVDAQGYAYVAGRTFSSNFPVLNSLQGYAGGTEAFVTVVNANGTALVFSTFLGGTGDDSAKGIAVDANGRIYVAGETSSTNFPISPASGALQASAGGGIEDAFVAAMQFCSYSLGVTGSPFPSSGGTGSLMIAAAAGCPWSAASKVPWITLGAPISGSGNGTVGFTVAPNTNPQTRIGALTAGWQSTQVTQAALTCTYALSATSASAFAVAGTASFAVTPNSSACPWTAMSNASWITITSGASVTGDGTVGYSIAANASTSSRAGTITVAGQISGQIFTVTQAGFGTTGLALRFVPVTPCRIADTRNSPGPLGGPNLAAATPRDFPILAGPCGIPANAKAYSLNLTVVPLGPLGFLSIWPAGQTQPVVSTLNSIDGRIKANAAIVPAGVNGAVTLFASNATHVIIDINGYFVLASGAQNLAFYPILPCRLADTRSGTGTLGGPALAAATSRDFPVLSGTCGIPASAQAYAFNMTVVPPGPLGFLSAWPAGNPQPPSSILNAPTGTVTANMAIVPEGAAGAITVIATNATDLIIDITGYFAPPGAGSLDFYTAAPCRVVDTRGPVGPFGGPIMGAGETRSFPVPSSSCGTPATAKAYSLNATVVPPALLGFLQLWGAGSQPTVSTLNSYDATIVSNAAIVPASPSGAVTAFVSNATHLILDINGYFQ